MNHRQAQVVCLVLTGIFLIAGWWPFAPLPHNRVSWLNDRSGLSFAPPAVAYDADPLPVPVAQPSDKPAPGIAIELSLEAAREPSSGVSHILTIYDGRLPASLAIVQWKSELLVRVPAPENARRFRETGIATLRRREPHVIAITSDSAGTAFFVDGRLSRRVPGFVLPPESLRGQLLLGNAPTGKSSWSGRLFGAAIFNRALDSQSVAFHQEMWTRSNEIDLAREPGLIALYNFAEGSGQQARDHSPARHTLLMPSRYVVLRKTVLESPERALLRDWHAAKDVLLNLLGFVPFGFFALHYRRGPSPVRWLRPAITATLAGAAVSLVIELGQVWLPSRDSSFLDLVCNTAGTGAGVFLAWIVDSRRRRPGSSA